MKTYKGLYDKCLNREYIRQMILETAKGKRKRRDVMRTLQQIDRYTEIIYQMLLNESYVQKLPKESLIDEGTKHKQRVIRKVRFFDQIIHHIADDACKEVFTHGMYVHCCGSVPGRGIHHAKRYVERWIRTDCKNTKYCVQMDIHHYFESVDHEILKAKLKKRIADRRMLKLLESIIDGGGEGLPLGFAPSQPFANFMLQDLDHFIKEQLHVKYYVRYMDDMVIFGRNKKELHRARAAIAEYLQTSLNLQMKGNYQLFRMAYTDRQGKERGKALDFMGFRFYRDRTVLRKSLMHRITRTAARIGRKNHPTAYDAARMLSYMGWVSHSDTYGMYERWIKPKVSVKQLKKIASKSGKEKTKHVKNCMENGGRDAGGKAGSGGHKKQPVEGISAQEYHAGNDNAGVRGNREGLAVRGGRTDAGRVCGI